MMQCEHVVEACEPSATRDKCVKPTLCPGSSNSSRPPLYDDPARPWHLEYPPDSEVGQFHDIIFMHPREGAYTLPNLEIIRAGRYPMWSNGVCWSCGPAYSHPGHEPYGALAWRRSR